MISNFCLILLLTPLTLSLYDCGSGYGYFIEADETGYCLICSAGTYSPSGSYYCYCCSSGEYSAFAGSSQCSVCNAGYYSLGCATSCTPCPQGSYNGAARAWSCFLCPENTFASSTATITCTNCLSFGPTNNCKLCPLGTHNNKLGRTSAIACTGCGVGFYDPEIETTFKQCKDCLPGTYADDQGMKDCHLCPMGTYNTKSKSITSEDCLPCSRGTYMPSRGMTSCLICPSGTACPNEGMAMYDICQRGTYTVSTGQIKCEDCPEGTYNPFTLGHTLSSCLRCNPGEYNDKRGQGACVSCPRNTYNTLMGRTSIDYCLKCQVGFYSVNRITNQCSPCHQYCVECFGPRRTECDSCRTDINNFGLVEDSTCSCKEGYYEDIQEPLISNICKPCYDLCATCEGSPNHCTRCINGNGVVRIGNNCVCREPDYILYHNENTGKMECITCHSFCTICYGPLASQCDECNESIGATMIGTNTCACRAHSFYNERQGRCVSCHLFCDNCRGTSNRDCIGCNSLHSYQVYQQESLCVASCYDLRGYYLNGNICEGNLFFNS